MEALTVADCVCTRRADTGLAGDYGVRSTATNVIIGIVAGNDYRVGTIAPIESVVATATEQRIVAITTIQ